MNRYKIIVLIFSVLCPFTFIIGQTYINELMASNQLSSLGSILNLSKIKALNLGKNQLKALDPKIGNLIHLEILKLQANAFACASTRNPNK